MKFLIVEDSEQIHSQQALKAEIVILVNWETKKLKVIKNRHRNQSDDIFNIGETFDIPVKQFYIKYD